MRSFFQSKWKWVVLVIAVLLLVGLFFACRSGSDGDENIPNTKLADGFSAKANIHFGDIEATATFNRIGDGIYDITIISPQALNGMNFQYNGADIEISYLGMSVKLDDDGLIANAMTSALVKAVDTAARDSGVSMKKSGKAIILKGTNENGDFELYLDKNTGSLLTVKVPGIDLEASFGADSDGAEG